ncbi:hypothetical protein BH23ACT4_BH23ACT4_07700 [soil metagenome]
MWFRTVTVATSEDRARSITRSGLTPGWVAEHSRYPSNGGEEFVRPDPSREVWGNLVGLSEF